MLRIEVVDRINCKFFCRNRNKGVPFRYKIEQKTKEDSSYDTLPGEEK